MLMFAALTLATAALFLGATWRAHNQRRQDTRQLQRAAQTWGQKGQTR